MSNPSQGIHRAAFKTTTTSNLLLLNQRCWIFYSQCTSIVCISVESLWALTSTACCFSSISLLEVWLALVPSLIWKTTISCCQAIDFHLHCWWTQSRLLCAEKHQSFNTINTLCCDFAFSFSHEAASFSHWKTIVQTDYISLSLIPSWSFSMTLL